MNRLFIVILIALSVIFFIVLLVLKPWELFTQQITQPLTKYQEIPTSPSDPNHKGFSGGFLYKSPDGTVETMDVNTDVDLKNHTTIISASPTNTKLQIQYIDPVSIKTPQGSGTAEFTIHVHWVTLNSSKNADLKFIMNSEGRVRYASKDTVWY